VESRRCESCMKMIEGPVCEHCGYPQNKQNEPHQLPVGTELGARYQIGKALGQGGFGITYLGWDMQAEERVAIKEFYPSSTVNRDCSQTKVIHCNTTQMESHYQVSRERFLREAKALAQLQDIPEIVGIRDFLEENNTAYIVMEYVQGMDLAHYIQRRGGRLTVDETFRILKPVMEALAKVHKLGMVHRDISPDNIILHPMGGAKLLDFGAVRSVEGAEVDKVLTKSTEAILKHGFAPIEQYQTRGSLGPWTDEYAMCATIYYCLTGRIIVEATTRMAEEIDPDWSGIPGLTERQIAALSKGVSVRARDRFPNLDELLENLFPQPVKMPEKEPEKTREQTPETEKRPKTEKKPKPEKQSGNKGKTIVMIAACAAVVLAVAGILAAALPGILKDEPALQPQAGSALGIPPGQTSPAATEPGSYTYNTSQNISPENWSPFTYETEEDLALLSEISAGLYAFDYNASGNGYALVPEMAAQMPVDVTKDYIGQYGLETGDTEQAWSIALRDDLCWEDGTPITAVDFVESAKRLLDPAAQNSGAVLMYDGRSQGCLSVVGAGTYYYGGKSVFLENAKNACFMVPDLEKIGEDYYTPDNQRVYLAVDMALEEWLGGNTLKSYVDAYGAQYFSLTYWDRLISMMDENGLVPLTDETKRMFLDVITGNPAWGETEYDLYNYLVYQTGGDPISWNEVGILAAGERELVLILEEPKSGFDLLLALSEPWLVDTELYDSLAVVSNDAYSNTYGTSLETTRSYGPYRLASFTENKQYVLERSETFFGLTEDTYQATRWVVDIVDNMDTQFQMFLNGQLDETSVPSAQLKSYVDSPELYFTDSESIFGVVFNPDMENLRRAQSALGANVNKTILTVTQFRMAMSVGLDREGFALTVTPGNKPALGLFSAYSISDPESGTSYRSTVAAKETLVDAWGLGDSYGPGKAYAGLDEAEASITGYDPEYARELFNEAYDLAIAQGLLTANSEIRITVGLPSDTDFYTNGFSFLQQHYTELVKGTKLEGKLKLESKLLDRNTYADALRSNEVDMLFGVGWSGSALDPYSMMDAYITQDYQYDPAIDYSAQMLTITIGNETLTGSVQSWGNVINGWPQQMKTSRGTYLEYSCGVQDHDPETRIRILAEIEGAVLRNYCFIPLLDDCSAGLWGRQVVYPDRPYTYGVGFGGIKYLRFNYSDEQWDAYIADQGGTVDYTQ